MWLLTGILEGFEGTGRGDDLTRGGTSWSHSDSFCLS